MTEVSNMFTKKSLNWYLAFIVGKYA
jgi:hypothetical protein